MNEIKHTNISCVKEEKQYVSKSGDALTNSYYKSRCTITEGPMKGKRVNANGKKKKDAVDNLEKKLKELASSCSVDRVIELLEHLFAITRKRQPERFFVIVRDDLPPSSCDL